MVRCLLSACGCLGMLRQRAGKHLSELLGGTMGREQDGATGKGGLSVSSACMNCLKCWQQARIHI